jgi:hypothetical protein
MTQTTDNRRDTSPTERIGMVVYILMENRGRKFTTMELAKAVSLQHHSMWTMLCKLSRKLPIVQEIDGWYIP